jgi:hypothetical protein
VLADGPQTTVIREHRQIAIDAGTEEPSGVRCGPPVNAPGQQAANSVTKPCVRCKDERISLTTVRPFIERKGAGTVRARRRLRCTSIIRNCPLTSDIRRPTHAANDQSGVVESWINMPVVLMEARLAVVTGRLG